MKFCNVRRISGEEKLLGVVRRKQTLEKKEGEDNAAPKPALN